MLPNPIKNTKYMIRIFYPFLLLSVTVFGQSSIKETGNKTTLNDWKTFDQAAYTIQYPSTWELNQSEQMGTSFILFSPLESEKDQFKENVNLLIQDLAGYHVDLNEYTEITEGQIKTMVTNANLSESVRVKNDKGEYHKLIYSGDQGVFHLTYEQYYWVMNDKAFILTFTSEQNKFVQMADTGEKILNSFKLKK
jgi:hypothetical protein